MLFESLLYLPTDGLQSKVERCVKLRLAHSRKL